MVNPKRCKFYVNKEKNVIICVIPNTRSDFTKYIFSLKDKNSNYNWLDIAMLWGDKYKMPGYFMGKAVCAEGDEWNEELGKKIAYLRARDKYYKTFFKLANSLFNASYTQIDNAVDEINMLGMKLEYRRNNIQQEIEESLNK